MFFYLNVRVFVRQVRRERHLTSPIVVHYSGMKPVAQQAPKHVIALTVHRCGHTQTHHTHIYYHTPPFSMNSFQFSSNFSSHTVHWGKFPALAGLSEHFITPEKRQQSSVQPASASPHHKTSKPPYNFLLLSTRFFQVRSFTFKRCEESCTKALDIFLFGNNTSTPEISSVPIFIFNVTFFFFKVCTTFPVVLFSV